MLRSTIPLEKINICRLLLFNSNPNVMTLLENEFNSHDCLKRRRIIRRINFALKNLKTEYWRLLSRNPNVTSLLEQNLDKVDWYNLSCNLNAISLLEQNLDKVDWHQLSRNPNAISLLEQNLDKVDWYWLSINPGIFEDEDYACK